MTVPASFNEGHGEARKDAEALAKLNVTIMIEPVAAAIAYRLDRTADSFDKMNVLVFDLRVDTFYVAVLTISNWNIDVKTISGDTHMGGEDKYVISKTCDWEGQGQVWKKPTSRQDVQVLKGSALPFTFKQT